MNVKISSQKNILFVNFACNSDLVTKELVAWSINDNFLLQNYVAESANYASNAFFRKKGEIMLVVTNYAKNYVSTIDKGLKWTESIKNSSTAETLIWEYIGGRLIWVMTKLWLKSTNWSGEKTWAYNFTNFPLFVAKERKRKLPKVKTWKILKYTRLPSW